MNRTKKKFLVGISFLLIISLPLEHYRRSQVIIGKWRSGNLSKPSFDVVFRNNGTFEDRFSADFSFPNDVSDQKFSKGEMYSRGKYKFSGMFYLDTEITDYYLNGESNPPCQPSTPGCPVNKEDGMSGDKVFFSLNWNKIYLEHYSSGWKRLNKGVKAKGSWLYRVRG